MTTTLPAIITNVRRAPKGYSVYDGKMWTYYAAADLNPEQVSELEDWLEEVKPARKAA